MKINGWNTGQANTENASLIIHFIDVKIHCILTVQIYIFHMRSDSIQRLLPVPKRSFFLFGPRSVGKSTWVRNKMPDAFVLDLLDSSLFLELSQQPSRLEAMIGGRKKGSWVVLDEIQKIPALLDEVHRLMELRGWRFVLCGSSARKLRRSGTNLLAGRALSRHLGPFSFAELGDSFSLDFSLEWGLLPIVQTDRKHSRDILSAYVNTYIKEEIREEGAIRNLAPFLRFLGIAGLMNGQSVNGQNISREAAVPRSSVDSYFSILEDTLLGHFLPAYRPRVKVREQAHPKFYWFDTGVARAAAGLLFDPADRLWKGVALETLIFHELRTYNEIKQKHRQIFYYRTASGVEIDFLIETRKALHGAPPRVVTIEVKLSEKWDRKWEQPMRSLQQLNGIKIERMFGVYMGPRSYDFGGLQVLPVTEFLKQLYAGKVY